MHSETIIINIQQKYVFKTAIQETYLLYVMHIHQMSTMFQFSLPAYLKLLRTFAT